MGVSNLWPGHVAHSRNQRWMCSGKDYPTLKVRSNGGRNLESNLEIEDKDGESNAN